LWKPALVLVAWAQVHRLQIEEAQKTFDGLLHADQPAQSGKV
jgi:hypothetical protein